MIGWKAIVISKPRLVRSRHWEQPIASKGWGKTGLLMGYIAEVHEYGRSECLNRHHKPIFQAPHWLMVSVHGAGQPLLRSWQSMSSLLHQQDSTEHPHHPAGVSCKPSALTAPPAFTARPRTTFPNLQPLKNICSVRIVTFRHNLIPQTFLQKNSFNFYRSSAQARTPPRFRPAFTWIITKELILSACTNCPTWIQFFVYKSPPSRNLYLPGSGSSTCSVCSS